MMTSGTNDFSMEGEVSQCERKMRNTNYPRDGSQMVPQATQEASVQTGEGPFISAKKEGKTRSL